MRLKNYVKGEWVEGTGRATELFNAVTGERIADASTGGIDFADVLALRANGGRPDAPVDDLPSARPHAQGARSVSHGAEGPVLRSVQGHRRYKGDSWIDIDGGIGTLFAYGSRGRRDFPDETFYVDGPMEMISKGGTFVGRHICVPLEGRSRPHQRLQFSGVGYAGEDVDGIARRRAIDREAGDRHLISSPRRSRRRWSPRASCPPGAFQLLCGSAGDLLDHLDGQDAVAFTGSAATGQLLKSGHAMVSKSVRFNQEADSLNFSMLGPDAHPGTEEFDLFVKEVVREMTVKAGQKCTAIRRTFVPACDG